MRICSNCGNEPGWSCDCITVGRTAVAWTVIIASSLGVFGGLVLGFILWGIAP